MADHELLPFLQDYLASSSWDEKDNPLRRMRDLVGSAPDGEAVESQVGRGSTFCIHLPAL